MVKKKRGAQLLGDGKEEQSRTQQDTSRFQKKKKVMFGIRNTVHNKTGNKKKKEEHGIVINAT